MFHVEHKKKGGPLRVPLNTSHFDFYKSDYFLILRSRKECIKFRRIGKFDLDHPTFSIRIRVDEFRVSFQSGVHFCNLAGNRHESIRNRFYGLDGTEYFLFGQGLTLGLNVYKNNVAQFALGEVRNPDDSDIAFYTDPLVIFRVFQFSRCIHNRYFFTMRKYIKKFNERQNVPIIYFFMICKRRNERLLHHFQCAFDELFYRAVGFFFQQFVEHLFNRRFGEAEHRECATGLFAQGGSRAGGFE